MNAGKESTPSILIVDDTVENLRLLAGMLTTRGFDVRPVTSGQAALDTMAHAIPDLVLLDVTMPGMDGFEVCSRLKAHPEWKEIPVIFLTALTEVSDKVKGFSVGGVDYITKPFQLEEVQARVDSQLALRAAKKELAESLRRLQELERLRDDLVHMVVHDMRSPLSSLVMNLGLLKMQVPGELVETVDDVVLAARSLSSMANTLLDLSRLEEGKMPLKKAQCNLVGLARQAKDAVAAMDPSRAIEIEDSDVAPVSCDGDLVRRVLENLISNGIKHTPTGGRLRISVRRNGPSVHVAVQDEGQGVPAQARQRIFEKFGAVAARKDQSYHSVGLGLAFCKLAIEAHAGSIGVDAAVPRGSVFWFELPG
jgi:signal transduction histidine kinase